MYIETSPRATTLDGSDLTMMMGGGPGLMAGADWSPLSRHEEMRYGNPEQEIPEITSGRVCRRLARLAIPFVGVATLVSGAGLAFDQDPAEAADSRIEVTAVAGFSRMTATIDPSCDQKAPFELDSRDANGSKCVEQIQGALGLSRDGHLGKKSIPYVNEFLRMCGLPADSELSAPDLGKLRNRYTCPQIPPEWVEAATEATSHWFSATTTVATRQMPPASPEPKTVPNTSPVKIVITPPPRTDPEVSISPDGDKAPLPDDDGDGFCGKNAAACILGAGLIAGAGAVAGLRYVQNGFGGDGTLRIKGAF